MNFVQLLEYISAAYSILVLYLSWFIIKYWGLYSLRFPEIIKKDKKITGEQWLIFGIWIAFIGVFTNTLWWGIHFLLLSFNITNNITSIFYDYGSVVNLFTRHIPYSIAAFCHLRGLQLFRDKDFNPDRKLKIGFLTSFIILVIILLVNYIPK